MTPYDEGVRPLAERHPLLARPLPAVLTTICRDERLQSTPVWFSCDGPELVVSTMREFAKARNLRRRAVATVLVTDPDDSSSWVEVRAEVRLEEAGADEVLDDISHRYTGLRPYFGKVVPAHLAATEHPITCRLTPVRITTPHHPSWAGPTVIDPTLVRHPRPAVEVGCGQEPVLPTDHLDLLDQPLVASLATRLPSGHPQTQPVWFARDGSDLLVNTTLERRKGRNLLADPRATLLVIDPADSGRWIEVRADVDLSTRDAVPQLDALTRRYTPHRSFYGGVYPVDQRDVETRVIARLHPRRIHCDAIH